LGYWGLAIGKPINQLSHHLQHLVSVVGVGATTLARGVLSFPRRFSGCFSRLGKMLRTPKNGNHQFSSNQTAHQDTSGIHQVFYLFLDVLGVSQSLSLDMSGHLNVT